ncbi:cupredoxin domain-containing protein [Sulfoacidibacillus thermotolerans]|uniref:EfeO-type cupredoxin-like domain-containing protein n=1 Tax=Sulfoacidibacillus thermotolerans TaxID=1765684 RepID=A0A2U3DCG0_SULT2|nr:cupredoxin domain-containing protein [Sulfoacidibacillus thermotolerans]PWI58958.1 hypothetical protein BM613_02485 [Sulfoacidibacillus thermotolerans]
MRHLTKNRYEQESWRINQRGIFNGARRLLLLLMCLSIGLWLKPTPVFAATYHIIVTDKGFFPKKITGSFNQPVTITVCNKGTKTHNFILPAFYIYSPNLAVHCSTTVQFTPDKTGVFQFYSDAGGSKEPGLIGEIDVH